MDPAPSFRNRVLSLAMDKTCAPLHPVFANAASICNSKEAAMAFGYLMGKQDADHDLPTCEPSIEEQVQAVIDNCCEGGMDQEYATELVFGLIYKWVDKMYEGRGFAVHHSSHPGSVRYELARAFQPFVRPDVISPPLED